MSGNLSISILNRNLNGHTMPVLNALYSDIGFDVVAFEQARLANCSDYDGFLGRAITREEIFLLRREQFKMIRGFRSMVIGIDITGE